MFKIQKKLILSFLQCNFRQFFPFFSPMASYLNNHERFSKKLTEKEPRDLRLEAEVLSQKIVLNDFLKILKINNRFSL
jgi:hypothetical protein